MHAISQDSIHPTEQQILGFLADEVKLVTVHSNTMSVVEGDSDPFTLYTLRVTCPATKIWWIIKRRYSQFHALRQSLVRAHKKFFRGTSLASLLLAVAELAFPKKALRLDTSVIVAERKVAFDVMTKTLMAVRADCVVFALQHDQSMPMRLLNQLRAVQSALDGFLAIPDVQKKEELRVLVDHVSPHSGHRHDGDETDDECSICLCALADISQDGEPLRLGCGHAFHEECVLHWLDVQMSCPLCREPSGWGGLL
ncbi:Aste57867_21660 [Aphanomyces stellatus]|uniref:RING-type E3 ubiquitin transferase n=1 Tax=Aphanomyces stellatus TaxID=120398 RepID=A0A485LJC2_9STRA|nr:hypothetical protein As57867_021591 [Aphanomyces stellatus]VFT98329.1 Aste57867_21660 [Aphanomyces stellatus]